MRIQGVFHVHSSFSSDGEKSLYELSCHFQKNGIDFCVLGDHFESFDEISFKDYLSQIREINSLGKFLFIPGAEIALDVIHVLVFPLTEYSTDCLSALLQSRPGIISVLTHPKKLSDDETRTVINDVIGFELWNQRQDGNHFPSFRFIKRARVTDMYHRKTIFFGVDLHSVSYLNNRIVMDLKNNELDTAEIVSRLRLGDFTNVHIKRNIEVKGNQSSKEVELKFSLLDFVKWCLLFLLRSCLRVSCLFTCQSRKVKIADYIKNNL